MKSDTLNGFTFLPLFALAMTEQIDALRYHCCSLPHGSTAKYLHQSSISVDDKYSPNKSGFAQPNSNANRKRNRRWVFS